MKFLVFTDVHEDKKMIDSLLKRASEDDIDFIICCGDFSEFGRGMKNILTKFDNLGKKMYVLPGNHEEPVSEFLTILSKFDNCINFHEQDFEIDGYVFLGHGAGGFAQQDPEFRVLARKWYGKYKGKKIVFVTHMPPYNTKLDKLEMGHVGHIDYRKFIERITPKLAISGHLHETVDISQKIGKVQYINPGWKGKVIELK